MTLYVCILTMDELDQMTLAQLDLMKLCVAGPLNVAAYYSKYFLRSY
jgi:hypothetical protein